MAITSAEGMVVVAVPFRWSKGEISWKFMQYVSFNKLMLTERRSLGGVDKREELKFVLCSSYIGSPWTTMGRGSRQFYKMPIMEGH